ncbi:DUF1993 domain-containing protein [Bradyrhizobium sp. LjRoot220]|uniref:DUF1993 domain-containing protein n=1 Tax=Bradyrhizobium sp. LjRoot220 TaxID=3342284 RepID=UPI003ECCFFA6
MNNSSIARFTEIFTTRLQVLARLLDVSEAQLRDKGRDPQALLTARLADDMVPFPHQIVYCCNQPNQFAAWCVDAAWSQTDPATLDFAGLKSHLGETLRYLAESAGKTEDRVLEREKRIELGGGRYLTLPGALFVDDWLLPNFYFHLVTAYDILRHEGVQIGKADYMAHLAGRVRTAKAS